MLYVSDTLLDNVRTIDTEANVEVGDPIPMAHSRPLAPVVSPDGQFVYVQSVDGAISVIDTTIHAVARTFDNPNPESADGPASMTISPDGRILYASAAGTGDIARIDTATGAVASRITGGAAGAPPLIRVSHDGQILYVLDGVAGTITALDPESGSVIGEVTVPLSGQLDLLQGLALTPDDSTLVTVTYLGNFVQIDTESMTVRSSEQVGRTLYGVDLSPDGSHVFIVQANDGCVIDRDLAGAATTETGFAANNCFEVAVARDGRHAYLADYAVDSNSYSVMVFDLNDRTARAIAGFAYPNFDAQSIGPSLSAPQPGAWWNPAESGRSFDIEVRHGTLVLIAQVYDDAGAPTWLMASGPYDAASDTFSGAFVRYSGGQCLGCAYRVPDFSPLEGADVRLVFTSDTTGTLTYGGSSIPIQKFDW